MVSLTNGGRPSVLVPVTQAQPADALAFIRKAAARKDVDILELRVDCLKDATNADVVVAFVAQALAALDGKRSILTFRTAAEGGNAAIAPDRYVALYAAILDAARPSFLDVEFNRGKDVVDAVLADARAHDVATIISSHDFAKTDGELDLVNRMEEMRKTGADVVKLAVMPNAVGDLLSLLGATAVFRGRHPDVPLITMSMGRLGLLSRLAGEIFGSDASFGKIDDASAPGQIDAALLNEFLDRIHAVWAADPS